MKVIFGGTFDPVHIGHLRMATELLSALEVNRISLMPCYKAVHKESVGASASERLAMLTLSCEEDEHILVDDREIRRGTASYTIDSIRQIREDGVEEPLCIVMGTDSALSLDSWCEIQSFASLTHVVVVRRPGESEAELNLMRQKLSALGFTWADRSRDLHAKPCGLALLLELTQLDVSSSMIRASIKENKSIRYLVMGAVEKYICDNGLYRN